MPAFVDGVYKIAKGESQFASIEIDAENERYALVFCEIAPGILRIEAFEDAYFSDEDYIEESCPLPSFTGYNDKSGFCRQVCENLADMVRLMTVDKYKEIWHYDLPVEKLKLLGKIVKVNIQDTL